MEPQIEMKHTPTPWKVVKIKDYPPNIIGDDVSILEEISDEDAAFIVRAVNSHEALLNICKRILREVYFPNNEREIYEELKYAIAQTEGKA